jgi:organic radical activating enzyme
MTKIREIFTSIQGEGPFVGYKQLFVRFSKCNLNCKYCDTDFDINKSKEYTPDELAIICENNRDCHSISLTGGEPLLEVDFLKDFLPICPLEVYLETNGTLWENLAEIIDYVSDISADIKLPSATNQSVKWDEHDKFFEIASRKNLFAKVVFDSSINDIEIFNITKLCKKYDIELILQPMMIGNKSSVTPEFISKILDKCLKFYPNVRVIPQTHKFIGVD